ncbi:15544_t:CDS:2, partial [Cetraspora pellucida]
NFESRLNLEDSIISDNYYSQSFLEDLKTHKTQLKIIELDDDNSNNNLDSNNNIIDSYDNIMSLQETIIISSDSKITCKFEILENWYLANELELLGMLDYLDLDIVLLNKTLSLRQASIKQNNTFTTQSSSSRQINHKF